MRLIKIYGMLFNGSATFAACYALFYGIIVHIIQAVYETNRTLGWDSEPINVTALMNPWILQMNFPVVTVTRQYGSQSASMYQSRFLLPGNFSGNPAYENPVYKYVTLNQKRCCSLQTYT